jgi:hypothetical protein
MGPSMSSDFVVEVLSEWQIRLNLVSGHFRLICSMEATCLFSQEHSFGNGKWGFPTSILRGQDWVSILGFVILCQKQIVEQFHEIHLMPKEGKMSL